MKKSALIFILFISVLLVYNTNIEAAFDFFIGEEQVELTTPLATVNGNILVPATIFDQYLAARTDYDSENEQFTIRFPMVMIEMVVGERTALVNGEDQALDCAPQFANGELMVPLRFIADLMKFRIVYDPKNAALTLNITEDIAQLIAAGQALDQEHDYEFVDLFSKGALGEPSVGSELKAIVYLGGSRSRVFLDIDGLVAYDSFLLREPDRLVIDLHGVSGVGLPVQEIGGSIIQRIRSDRFDFSTIRVVFELNKATDYKISRWPDGGLEIEFNYQIGEIGYYKDDQGTPRIWYVANEQPTFQVLTLPSPPRLVLDFQDSTLVDGAREIIVTDERVRTLRASQHNKSVARVVLDLTEPLVPVTVEMVNNRYEIILFEGTEAEYIAYLDRELESSLPIVKPEPVTEVDDQERDSNYEFEPDEVVIDPGQVLAGRIIVIDPGHGGSDPGSIGYSGTFEKDVVLEISLRLGKLLEEAGAFVAYTRQDDRYISVFDRPKIAEMANGEVLISIHANSYPGQNAQGIETLYNPLYLENFRLAQIIQNELVAYVDRQDRGVRPRTDLAVLNNAIMPAILVEAGFVNHPEEELFLLSSEYQQDVAQGVFNGLEVFFTDYR